MKPILRSVAAVPADPVIIMLERRQQAKSWAPHPQGSECEVPPKAQDMLEPRAPIGMGKLEQGVIMLILGSGIFALLLECLLDANLDTTRGTGVPTQEQG